MAAWLVFDVTAVTETGSAIKYFKECQRDTQKWLAFIVTQLLFILKFIKSW